MVTLTNTTRGGGQGMFRCCPQHDGASGPFSSVVPRRYLSPRMVVTNVVTTLPITAVIPAVIQASPGADAREPSW